MPPPNASPCLLLLSHSPTAYCVGRPSPAACHVPMLPVLPRPPRQYATAGRSAFPHAHFRAQKGGPQTARMARHQQTALTAQRAQSRQVCLGNRHIHHLQSTPQVAWRKPFSQPADQTVVLGRPEHMRSRPVARVRFEPCLCIKRHCSPGKRYGQQDRPRPPSCEGIFAVGVTTNICGFTAQ